MNKRTKILRVAGMGLGGLVLLGLGGFAFASLQANAKLQRKFESHRVDIAVPNPLTEQELAALRDERTKAQAPAVEGGVAAAEQNPNGAQATDPLAGLDLTAVALERAIARGKHLVEARYACAACHGKDFAGGIMIDEPAIGSLRGPNLTSGKGGVTATYTVNDWDRIVRHGLKPDGSPAVMPSEDFFSMSDYELSDIIAFIGSLPAVDGDVSKPSFGPIGKILIATGKFPLAADQVADHQSAHGQSAPQEGDTPEFGKHLAATCTGCHRANLAGGPMPFGPPDWPAAANLTVHETGLSGWTFEDFERALKEGKSKDGRALREPMSHVVPGTRAMTTLERKALWTYLASIQPQAINP